MGHSNSTISTTLIAPTETAEMLVVGDIINGDGIPTDTVVTSIVYLGNGQWGVGINITISQATAELAGNHTGYIEPSGQASGKVAWNTSIAISKPHLPFKTVSFSEKVKGWVSFKSFNEMQMGASLANDYYTFYKGRLFLHYSETQDRNTFYKNMGLLDDGFTASTLDVILNDNPGTVKVFNTLNYEGSQAKVEKFTSEAKSLEFQPLTTYNDQEYYNLYAKRGWSVSSVTTNKETGYVKEFIEKDGEWFNSINKEVDKYAIQDTGDFTFQGIGIAGAIVGGGGGGGGGQIRCDGIDTCANKPDLGDLSGGSGSSLTQNTLTNFVDTWLNQPINLTSQIDSVKFYIPGGNSGLLADSITVPYAPPNFYEFYKVIFAQGGMVNPTTGVNSVGNTYVTPTPTFTTWKDFVDYLNSNPQFTLATQIQYTDTYSVINDILWTEAQYGYTIQLQPDYCKCEDIEDDRGREVGKEDEKDESREIITTEELDSETNKDKVKLINIIDDNTNVKRY